MSVVCGAECFLAVGCLRWLWKRCTYVGGDDSATWPQATAAEFDSVPHLCRIILAVYEEDLHHPKSPPLGGYRLNPNFVDKRVTYQETLGQAPPYLIYLDHDRKEIVLAIRGLNLKKESDYKLLLNNRLGMQMFDGGYVHHGC
ncbi:putative mono-/di-acylglycerol lipase, alpha/Beta hydrolase [Helianthus annuus]|nr:putative mono-/di-acylglycerol lipase, alpha/Beta hydrolase [Helianthus annuus]